MATHQTLIFWGVFEALACKHALNFMKLNSHISVISSWTLAKAQKWAWRKHYIVPPFEKSWGVGLVLPTVIKLGKYSLVKK